MPVLSSVRWRVVTMRQVTGSNIAISTNKVSIQLPLGGHSFSVDSLPDALLNSEQRVEFCVLTPRTTLVPREVFDEKSIENYLDIVGLGCSASERAVASDNLEQIVAVMAIDSQTLDAINLAFGSRASFTTPLLTLQKYSSAAVWLYREENLLYIKVYNTTLRFAEVVECECDADIVQVINDLDKIYSLSDYAIYCHGVRPAAMRKLLSKYYSDVRCE